jgi:phage baseplate assembly protein gpV
MCSCNKAKTTTASATKRPVTVAFPDGSKKSYDTETQARVAAASKNGKLVAA